jgi:DNA polymerase elongation subunit (family B)
MPSKPDELPKDDFKSKVLRKTFDTGLFKDCISVDLSSAYPHTIIDFNLDPSNLVTGITPTSLELAGANFEQNAGAIFPTVAKKLITIKTEIANERDSYPVDSKEYKEKKVAYSAIKGIVNSIFGVFGDKRTRLYNKDIARAITRLPKEMLLYCLDKLEKLNIFPLYADTDGIILNTEENITEMLNAFIKKWAKEKFGTDKEISTTFDCEGIWKSILILKRCRYHGFLQHTNGEIEEKNVGLESKRKDSSKFIKKFQKELVQKIHNGISKEEVIKWVKKEKENIRTAPLEDIAFPCKLSKPIEDYDSRSIWVRAYEYANELYGYKVRIGQPYYYIYVESGEYEDKIVELEMINGSKLTNSKLKNYWCEYFGVPHILVKNMDKEKLKELKDNLKEKGIIYIEKGEMRGRKKDVIAFDEKNKEHMKHYEINWKKMIERNIDNKSEVIFGALDWLDTE